MSCNYGIGGFSCVSEFSRCAGCPYGARAKQKAQQTKSGKPSPHRPSSDKPSIAGQFAALVVGGVVLAGAIKAIKDSDPAATSRTSSAPEIHAPRQTNPALDHKQIDYNNGDSYVGLTLNGKFHGHGTYYENVGDNSRSMLTGEWSHGQINGEKVNFIYPQGKMTYVGSWKDGAPYAWGTMFVKGAGHIKGNWVGEHIKLGDLYNIFKTSPAVCVFDDGREVRPPVPIEVPIPKNIYAYTLMDDPVAFMEQLCDPANPGEEPRGLAPWRKSYFGYCSDFHIGPRPQYCLEKIAPSAD